MRRTFGLSMGALLAAGALMAPTALAEPLGAPDALLGEPPPAAQPSTPQGIGAPDAVLQAPPEAAPAPLIDLRTPDAIDRARETAPGTGGTGGVDLAPLPAAPLPTGIAADGGFDWGDAAIGAGTIAGLALLALGGALAFTHHRHRHLPPPVSG